MKIIRWFISLLIVLALQSQVFGGAYDAYKLAFNERNWDTKYNGLVSALGVGVLSLTVPDIDYIGNYADSLATAVTDVGAANKLLLVNTGTTVAADLVVPANLVIWPSKEGLITINDGVTLTINSPFDALPHQVFNCIGSGKVVFGAGAAVKIQPHWWYAGSGSWHTAFQHAINSCAISGNVKPRAGNYGFSSGFTIPPEKYLAFAGAGPGASNFYYNADYDGSPLIQMTGAASPPAANRSLPKTLSGFSITGRAILGPDGKGIVADYGVNVTLRDINLTDIRNIALEAAHQWDLQGYNIQTYNCGAADGSHTGTIPAWMIGEAASTGNNGTNAVTFIGCRVERSPERDIWVRGATQVRFIGLKGHGTLISDANWQNYLGHLRITNSTQVSFDATCQFEGCRSGFGASTVGVWGGITIDTENDGVSIVTLNNSRFNSVGDDFNLPTYATYPVMFNPTGLNATSSKLIINGLEVNDATRVNPIIYTGASAGDNAIQIDGPITIRDTVNNPPLFYNARADKSNTVLHLEKFPAVQFPLFTTLPADTDAKDGALGPLQSADATAPLQSLLFHAGGKWRGVPQFLSASIATVTSGKAINAILPYLPTGLKYKVLALDVVCQTGPTEGFAAGNYWKIVVQGSGGSTESIILDATQSTKTVLGGSAIHFSKRSGFGGNKWDNTTPVQIYPVQTGTPAIPPADLNINVLVQPTS